MNFKKIFLLFIPLLAFLGMGTMLSNIDSGHADELLEQRGHLVGDGFVLVGHAQEAFQGMEPQFERQGFQVEQAVFGFALCGDVPEGLRAQ